MNKQKVAKYFGWKLVRFIVLMIAVAIFSFVLLDLSPIDPVNAYLHGAAVSEAQRQILQQYFGTNVPLPEKIFHWLMDLVQGNLGTSLIYRRPVIDVIIDKFMASLALMALSWILSGVIGFALGVVAGKNKGSWIDKAVKVYCYAIQSAPSFWVGMLVLMVFSVYLGWFPIGFGVPIGVRSTDATFLEWATRLVLPTLTLSLVGLAPITMYTRNELTQVLSSDYVLFAKSRGEKGWDLVKNHGIRNILLPAITLQFLSFSELFGGAVMIEQVFSYPGIGQTARMSSMIKKKANDKEQWFIYRANLRTKTLVVIGLAIVIILSIFISGYFIRDIPTNFANAMQMPSLEHLFGTDWMGRDMFQRTIAGLGLSIMVGFIASVVSTIISILLGLFSSFNKVADEAVAGIIDLFGSIPHILLIILVSIMFGGGVFGVIMGVGLTHWTPLARVLRSEVKEIKTKEYIALAENLGRNKVWIAIKHIFPLIISQIIVGVILMFPHAIMHEAAITFLGFGLPPHEPAIGVILAESMHYLSSGCWWLAFYPGLSLLLVVLLFDLIGENVEKLLNPETAQE